MATPQKLKEDFLTCNICMEVFQEPCTLRCEHTLCKECLSKYIPTQPDAIREKSIPCPFCRHKSPVPHPERPVEEWSGQFKAGLVIRGLMDCLCQPTPVAVLACSLCKEEGEITPASTWCSDCMKSLCDGCLKVHRRIPATRHHEVAVISKEDTKRKRTFMCAEHNEEMTLFCKTCNKFVCTVCCSASHKVCRNVVTITEMMAEVKQEIENIRVQTEMKIEQKNKRITTRKDCLNKLPKMAELAKSNVAENIKETLNLLLQKEKTLTDMVEGLTEEQKLKLNAEIKADKMSIQGYQQESQFLLQVLQTPCVSDMYSMYQSYREWARETTMDTDVQGEAEVFQIRFTHDANKLREAVETINVSILHKNKTTSATAMEPDKFNAAMGSDKCPASLRDVILVTVHGIQIIVVTDCDNNCLKSFFAENSVPCSNKLQFPKYPWSITEIASNKAAVSIPLCKQIAIVMIQPQLAVQSTISTSKSYYGLATLSSCILVVGSVNPPSIDTIDLSGTILKTFRHLLSPDKPIRNPGYIHVTEKELILVSDWALKSLICLTARGNVVFVYTNEKLISVCGLTTTKSGDILMVDSGSHKLIQITETGEFVADILSSANGLTYPYGLCLNDNTLYVALGNGNVKIQSLCQ